MPYVADGASDPVNFELTEDEWFEQQAAMDEEEVNYMLREMFDRDREAIAA